MTAAQLRTSMRVLVLAVVVVLPLVFWRGVSDPFETTKATVVWCIGPFAVALVAMYLWVQGNRAIPRAVAVASATLLAAVTLATATSMSPIQSLLGQPGRYTGLGTWVCLIALFLAACLSFDSSSVRAFAWVSTLVALPLANYAALQVSGHDPFAWSSKSFDQAWVSTFSNPNVSAAFVAIVLPLIAYTMLRSDAPRWASLLAALAFGSCVACLAVFSSFQGPVASLTTVAFLAGRAALLRAPLGEWTVSMGLALMVLVVPALPPSTSLIIVSGCIAATLLAVRPLASHLRAPASWRRNRRNMSIGAGVTVAALLTAASGRIIDHVQQGWRSGFLERGDFYRTAITVFRRNPILGSGLESFGLLFSRLRPVSHAVRFEEWTSSSAHNVPLGMFANGGIVLGGAYLAFVGLIGWTLLRSWRSSTSHAKVLVGAVGAAWLAFQVQSLVSVESVALFAFHLMLSGLIVALAGEAGFMKNSLRIAVSERDAVRSSAETGTEQLVDVRELVEVGATAENSVAVAGSYIGDEERSTSTCHRVEEMPHQGNDDVSPKSRRIAPSAFVAALTLCTVLVATVSIRPMRADAAKQSALDAAIGNGDFDRALTELRRAIDLAPWSPDSRVLLSRIEMALGHNAEALAALEPVLDMRTGMPLLLEQCAEVARKAGDDVLSLEFLERALAANPNGPEMRKRAAGYFEAAGERAAAAGQVDVARNRLLRALDLEPGLQSAHDALAAL